jgi:hypothetical protein
MLLTPKTLRWPPATQGRVYTESTETDFEMKVTRIARFAPQCREPQVSDTQHLVMAAWLDSVSLALVL